MSEQKISDLLAESLAWVCETGRSPEEAAARHPEYAEELLELLVTSSVLERTEHPAPRPEFKAAARTRMINLINAQERGTQKPAVTKPALSRQIKQNHNLTRRLSMTWIVVLGLLAAALAGGGGAVYASADALPGDGFYAVKTALQDLKLAFSDDLGDVDLLLADMDTNIQELQQLFQLGRHEDMLAGLEKYQEKLQILHQIRNRIGYDESGTDQSLNDRIQTRLQLHTRQLEQLQQQTQDQLQLQVRLQEAIQLTETGKTYGPNDGGQPEEPGAPNGAGPGEPAQEGKPEDSGSGQGGKNEDPGPGLDNGGSGQGSKPEDAGMGTGEGQGEVECTCQEEGLYCVLGEVQNEFGQVQAGATCTCTETESYCYQYQYQYGEQNGEQNGSDNSQGGKP